MAITLLDSPSKLLFNVFFCGCSLMFGICLPSLTNDIRGRRREFFGKHVRHDPKSCFEFLKSSRV